ncbi:efflux RND transporter permease subunit [Bacillus cereus]|uniref:efflux RND transporter permease subunit n=1 Tax=Bacillus cereus TaxID=1396 RepID=UPI000470BE93|nr:efflux RND transporter permease subunit [Bacillus cereus]ARO67314.1 Multidrug transporter AcrB [Bacillus cereus]ASI71157.1 multidrug transporter AcrB [Bacillus cereus]KIZ28914.1 multidrug transporter AcrB [Bacillus cereus]MCU5337198.1 efflux RND transporter permease subunit [Bacillus cereus]MDZ4556623.1 efflux RND transporter permease subunit [Bacillus cereus]
MSWFTKWSFANKAAITLISIIIIAWGTISYFNMPMEFLPQADKPQVTVVVMGQGTDSKTMEEQVTYPIEQATATIKGKSGVLSTTGDGFSKIDLYFEFGTDMEQAKREVQESIGTISLPQYVSKPSIIQLDTSTIPISFVALTFKDGVTSENIEFINKKIEPIYNDVKGVAGVQKTGIEKSFISVKLDNEKLNQNQIPIQKVMEVLKGQNGAFSVGVDTIDGEASNIKVLGDLSSIKELGNVTVQGNVKLSDLATIKETKPENVINRFNGKDSIELTISKDSKANAVTLSKEIEKVTKKINDKYDNVEATVFLSTADMVENSVQSMIKEVLLGALFATIVIMIFLKSIKSTFITIVSIPLSLCITVILLSKSGITLNTLTLGGVAVAVGRLVDDSIVVIENIYRRMQTEKFSANMVVEATKEVGVAITASTLTTVAVFLPIGLVNGSLQEFILPFALTVTYSLLASLLVAITIVPVMSGGLLKNTKLKEHNPSARFTKVISWSLNHKWIVLSLSFMLFAGSIIAYFTMPKGAVESTNTDYIQVTLNYPADTPLDKVKKNVLDLEKAINKKDQVKYVMTYLGNSSSSAQSGVVGSPTKGQLRVFLKDEDDADKTIKEIEKEKERFSEAEFTAVAASVTGYADTNITIDVTGNNVKDLENATNNIKDKIKNIEGIQEVSTNQDEKKTVYSFVVDPSKGNTEMVASQLRVMLNKTPLGKLSIDNRQTDVMLEPVLDTKTPQDLRDITIMTESGSTPITQVAALKSDKASTNQFHKDGEPYLQVTAKVDPSKLSDVNTKIKSAIFGEEGKKGIKLPENVEVFVGGASVQQSEDFNDLFTTMLVSIGLVFLILVVTFKGFKVPIAILFSLPLAAIGSILGLMISGISVDITVLLGALMLIGIVVTNAIVLLDRVKKNEKTMTIRESLIEASVRRMRPIIMTAVATICAMLPLLTKNAETGSLVSQSLAVVVIGGLAVATMLTLIVIPCVYELFNFKKSKKQRFETSLNDDVNV